ncbi:MAG: hypothetical protein IJN17_08925 [Clostridia bacterium]|nr:hypothetical protein [Clostridia bacterium]
MKYCFQGDIEEVKDGLKYISDLLGWESGEDGISVKAVKKSINGLNVQQTDANGWLIEYGQKAHFFRALGFINQKKAVSEEFHFESCGFQLDLSQTNEVPHLHELKEMLARLALMGYNLFVPYMEDNFEVPDEPYFGYMRSRYTEKEFAEINEMAEMFGIEIMPMIEGLAHQANVLRWHPYANMQEDANTMLVGEPRTYEFLEHVLDAATKPFNAKRVYIALDEAFELGKGESLRRSGVYRPSFDYMREHMEHLIPMCEKRNLEFVTSGDMYMLASNPDGSVFERLYNTDRPMAQEIKDAANYPVNYCMWDYSHLEEETYEKLFNRYREFGTCDYFESGIWNWLGFGVDYTKTFATVIPGMRAAKKCKIKHPIVTTWGNDTGCENFWSDLLLGMQLFAEYSYGDEPDMTELAARFKACTGCEMEDFMELSYVDHLYDEAPRPGPGYTNFSRSLLWQNILFGIFDYYIRDDSLTPHFKRSAEALEKAATRNGKYGKYFETRAMCSRVLEMKATMGHRISEAYKAGNKKLLHRITDEELPEMKRRVEALYKRHRELWYSVYKPFGWEVEDLRYGSLYAVIDSTIFRLNQYLNGEVSSLDEITATRLSFDGGEKIPRTFSYMWAYTSNVYEPRN